MTKHQQLVNDIKTKIQKLASDRCTNPALVADIKNMMRELTLDPDVNYKTLLDSFEEIEADIEVARQAIEEELESDED